nr:DUF4193 family protein [Catellatospora sichuanensis]
MDKPRTDSIDADDSEIAASLEMAGTDQLDEELVVAVVPIQSDEFRCSRCFLIHHTSQRATAGKDLCRECA